MKKRLILSMAALAAVTLTSCQKDQVINQVPQEQAIEFGTYLGRDAQTKGTVLNNDNLDTEGFGVFAHYTGTENFTSTSITTSHANFMNNENVTSTDDGATWTYEPKKYWPNNANDKISFFAYAPYDDSDKITPSIKNYVPVVKYDVSNTISEHVDLTFANPQKDIYKGHANLTNGTTVNLTFFHALSRIGFSAISAASYANATITIKSITLSGEFNTTRELNLSTSNGTASTVTPATPATSNPVWSELSTDERIFEITGIDRTINTTTPTESTNLQNSNYIMIIPQEDVDITVSVTYDVATTDPAFTITNTVSKAINDFDFAAGKAYNFKLSIGLNSIEFDPTVENWYEIPESTTVYVPSAS